MENEMTHNGNNLVILLVKVMIGLVVDTEVVDVDDMVSG